MVAAAAAVLMPTPAAAAGMTPVEAAAAAAVAVADQPGDNTVEVPVALLQQLMAQQQSLQRQLLLLTAEVCVSGPPALHRAAAAAQQDDSVSLSAGSKGVFTLGYATSASSGTGTMARARSAAGYATAAAAPAAAASASARGSFVSRWAGLDCNLPRNGLSLVPSATWAATLYYEGHNGYPAWKDREEEQEQASQRGELGPQQSWRSGRRRTWHQFVRAMQLVEEVAKREQCTPIQAAKLVDQCLEARQVGKARKKSFACLGRSDKAESVRQMLGLPAKPESS
ncbi:expressed protein [Chlorella variabilis]|uniref:Expressed protein n=1 Tax=Chlorella variabilis TaxID=554065 RepID=E1Z2S3_CHLVA|nr:expressed protein [Chlorella variabilis]EFN59713.1 expressed protein [Chlorella variabilis]|eukprot:XP_005851815.1 expressed protein [Chlorella variabilis]